MMIPLLVGLLIVFGAWLLSLLLVLGSLVEIGRRVERIRRQTEQPPCEICERPAAAIVVNHSAATQIRLCRECLADRELLDSERDGC